MTNGPHLTQPARPHSTPTLKPETSSAISSTSLGPPDAGPRRVRILGRGERNGIWLCDGPRGYRVYYAWLGEEAGGWHTSIGRYPMWAPSQIGTRNVDARTITGDRDKDLCLYQFDELVRLGEPAYLFGPNGEVLPLPRYMAGIYR
uniref:Minor tail protein n=1 Tax=Mycobacterium phage JustASigh TaxID=3158894 RepID=A0AAU8GNK0_9CAUD